MNVTSLSGLYSPRVTANKEKEIQMNFIRSIVSPGLLVLTS